MSCPGSATSSEKVAEILKTLREDSQILLQVMFFAHFSQTPRLETFQSKIDNQFKMCVMQMTHKIGPRPRRVGL